MRFTATLAAGLALLMSAAAVRAESGTAPLPQRLSETGLFAPGSTREVRAGVITFSPQYPLWSDGATKRRWIALPEGSFIDAKNPDAWEFPAGTKLWKEFSVGRAVETRLIERLKDGSWRFASYVWNADGSDAVLAPSDGTAVPLDGERRYVIPSEIDCRACHEGARVPVLGFGALQLSSDRDPLAPHAEAKPDNAPDLRELVSRGLVRNLPQSLIDTPPRIAAASPTERAALGYLHANCSHCHGDAEDNSAAVPVGAMLAQSVSAGAHGVLDVLRSLIRAPSRYRGAAGATQIVVPGDAHASVLTVRMRSRDPRVQMPPLGTAVPDEKALALIERWINDTLKTR
jgi:hypothetical protein